MTKPNDGARACTTARLRSSVWLPEPIRAEIQAQWSSEGFGPIMKVTGDPAFNNQWLYRTPDALIVVTTGAVEFVFSLRPKPYRLTKGDELFIPGCCMYRVVCDAPAAYLAAYRVPKAGDEETAGAEDGSGGLDSYYASLKPGSPAAHSARSPREPGSPAGIVQQQYVTPVPPIQDTLSKDASDLTDANPRLRKRRLKVTVVEGRDLPEGTDSLYRVNLYYKEQIASTRTRMEHRNVTWDDSFIFEGSDTYMTVELQGIDRTRINLNDFYDALFESTGVVTMWVPVPMVAGRGPEEGSRIKLELQAEFNPRRESTVDSKHLPVMPTIAVSPDPSPQKEVPKQQRRSETDDRHSVPALFRA